MAEYLSNPGAYNYTPGSSPPSSPTPWDGLNDSDHESLGDSSWKLESESDPYSANAKATQSPLRHTRTKRQIYTTPLTPSSSFATSYGPTSPSPVTPSNISTPIRVQSKYTPSNDPKWKNAFNDAFNNGATTIDLDNANITKIPREINELNNMFTLPLDPPESPELPPVQSPSTASRSDIASAAARSRRVFSQSRSTNSLFSSGTPFKSKREIQLYLANNDITVLPSELFQLNNLTLLSLRGNKLRSLPPAIGNLKTLRSLNIANNELTNLPSELSCLHLQTLLLDPNPFLPKPINDSSQLIRPNGSRTTHSRTRELGPLVIHTQISRLTELALRAALRPSYELPRIPQPTFNVPPTWISDATVSNSLLTPTDSQSSIFSAPWHTPSLSRSNSVPNPYDSHTFPPHTLPLEEKYNLTLWLAEPSTANVHIEAVRHGTEDACNLYSWCPNPKHQANVENDANYGAIFILPAEERLEWVSTLAGCELSSPVPILWRGCSAGCLSFLDGDTSLTTAPLQGWDERDEDEEFMSGFGRASGGDLTLNEEEEETPVRVQTHIVWDDMMELDD